jgi:hypothetical protein
MDKEILRKFVLEEFKKKLPQENIDEPLMDKLMEEFCRKNPNDMEVLNVFDLTDEEISEINKNPEKAIADGTLTRIEYGQIINHAGLAYRSDEFCKYIDDLPDSVFERKV